MTVFLLFVIAVLLAYQVVRQPKPTTVAPVAPPVCPDAAASLEMGMVCDTTTFRLLAPSGEEEFEVSWHRGEVPPTYRHADVFYVRGETRADGSVEFQR